MKKLFVATAIFASLIPMTALSQEVSTPATDYALEQQILYPTAQGIFNGNGLVTRLEFTLATVDHLYPRENFSSCFDDIAPSMPANYTHLFNDLEKIVWFGEPVCAAMRAGLIQGDGQGNFRPFSTITTAEAAKILARAYGLTKPSLAETPKTPWYRSSLTALATYGAIEGSEIPGSFVNRNDMAQMFYVLRDERPIAWNQSGSWQREFASPAMEDAPVDDVSVSEQEYQFIGLPGKMTLGNDLENCPLRVSPGSPGVALLALEQEAYPRNVPRLSHRLLREVARQRYVSRIGAPDTPPSVGTLVQRCGVIGLASPGSANAAQGIVVPRTIEKRVPNRIVRAEAEARMHVGGIALSPSFY